MGYGKPDAYNQPEAFGLTIVEELAWWDYEFSACIVWRHTDGTLYIAQDSGCYCVSPFEDYTSLGDLDVLTSVEQAKTFADCVSVSESERQDFLRKVSELLR